MDDLLNHHREIVPDIINKVRPLAYFPEYLRSGYYPYFLKNPEFYGESLLRHVNLALEIDVTYLNQIELKYLSSFRKLLQLIGGQTPFSPNVSKISAEIETSRATVLNYLVILKMPVDQSAFRERFKWSTAKARSGLSIQYQPAAHHRAG